MIQRALMTLVFLLCAGVGLAAETKTKEGKVSLSQLVLGDSFPEITEAERALREVPFAPGAPAVVLLEAQQQDYQTPIAEVPLTRSVQVRRVKILTAAGGQIHGQFQVVYRGAGPRRSEEFVVRSVRARTVLADGTVIDASDGVHRDRTETGETIVSVAFPRAEVGAILEWAIETTFEGIYETVVTVDPDLPVLESRFVYMPDRDLRSTWFTSRMTDAEAKPLELKTAQGTAWVWRIRNSPPLAAEPNRPALVELTKSLYVVPVAYRASGYNLEFATTWEQLSKDRHESWLDWMRGGSTQAKALAVSATEGISDPLARAEALRRELHRRIRIVSHSDRALHHSADQVLEQGQGTSADLAATMATMLRTLDMKADLVAFRRRENGPILDRYPVPALLDDLLVRLHAGAEMRYFSPAASVPAGVLPSCARDVLAIPYDGKATAPVRLPPIDAAENRVARVASVRLERDGRATVQTTETYETIWAERLRDELRDRTADEQRALVEERLRRVLPGATLRSLAIEHLETGAESLVLRAEIALEGYATVAGQRMLFNPNLFSRLDAVDWAAESRVFDVDLGEPYETEEKVTVEIPEWVVEVAIPDTVDFDAGQVGFFRTSKSSGERAVTFQRHMRLNMHRFPASIYPGLRQFFGDVAAQDEKPLVLSVR